MYCLSCRNLLQVIVLMMLSTVTFAHPGHDHGHFMSDVIHVLAVIAIVGVVSVTAFVARQRFTAARRQDKKD